MPVTAIRRRLPHRQLLSTRSHEPARLRSRAKARSPVRAKPTRDTPWHRRLGTIPFSLVADKDHRRGDRARPRHRLRSRRARRIERGMIQGAREFRNAPYAVRRSRGDDALAISIASTHQRSTAPALPPLLLPLGRFPRGALSVGRRLATPRPSFSSRLRSTPGRARPCRPNHEDLCRLSENVLLALPVPLAQSCACGTRGPSEAEPPAVSGDVNRPSPNQSQCGPRATTGGVDLGHRHRAEGQRFRHRGSRRRGGSRLLSKRRRTPVGAGSVPRASLGESVTRHSRVAAIGPRRAPFSTGGLRPPPRSLAAEASSLAFTAIIWFVCAGSAGTVHGSGRGPPFVEHEDDACYAAGGCGRVGLEVPLLGSALSFRPGNSMRWRISLRVELAGGTIPWLEGSTVFQRSSVRALLADFPVTDSSRSSQTRNYEAGQDRSAGTRPRAPHAPDFDAVFRCGSSTTCGFRCAGLGVRPSRSRGRSPNDVSFLVFTSSSSAFDFPRDRCVRALSGSRTGWRPITGAFARQPGRGRAGTLATWPISAPSTLRPGRGTPIRSRSAWKATRRARSRPPAQCFSFHEGRRYAMPEVSRALRIPLKHAYSRLRLAPRRIRQAVAAPPTRFSQNDRDSTFFPIRASRRASVRRSRGCPPAAGGTPRCGSACSEPNFVSDCPPND